jgi:hypothetical protein
LKKFSKTNLLPFWQHLGDQVKILKTIVAILTVFQPEFGNIPNYFLEGVVKKKLQPNKPTPKKYFDKFPTTGIILPNMPIKFFTKNMEILS